MDKEVNLNDAWTSQLLSSITGQFPYPACERMIERCSPKKHFAEVSPIGGIPFVKGLVK